MLHLVIHIALVLGASSWIVIQQRFDGSENFGRMWNEYKKGFGSLQGEFWIGNEYLHHITASGRYMLHIELEEYNDRQHWAEYSTFSVGSESDSFRLSIGGYSGNAGDSMSHLDGAVFTTIDYKTSDVEYSNCANRYQSGWWYETCHHSNINGQYLPESSSVSVFNRGGMKWHKIHFFKSLKKTRMMIRPYTE